MAQLEERAGQLSAGNGGTTCGQRQRDPTGAHRELESVPSCPASSTSPRSADR